MKKEAPRRRQLDDLAAIIVEPLHRCITPRPGFLPGLRRLADAVDTLLIFDETVTGFRLAYGGAQEYYDVVPDLAAYGKGLGGGYPIGVVAGRVRIFGNARYVWFASSLGGNPVTAAAAPATLAEMRRPGAYPRFFALGEALRQGLRTLLARRGVVAQVLGDGPLAAVAFTAEPVVDYRSARRADPAKARAFLLGLCANGVFLNPMSTKFYLSLAHTEADLARVLDAADRVLRA